MKAAIDHNIFRLLLGIILFYCSDKKEAIILLDHAHTARTQKRCRNTSLHFVKIIIRITQTFKNIQENSVRNISQWCEQALSARIISLRPDCAKFPQVCDETNETFVVRLVEQLTSTE